MEAPIISHNNNSFEIHNYFNSTKMLAPFKIAFESLGKAATHISEKIPSAKITLKVLCNKAISILKFIISFFFPKEKKTEKEQATEIQEQINPHKTQEIPPPLNKETTLHEKETPPQIEEEKVNTLVSMTKTRTFQKGKRKPTPHKKVRFAIPEPTIPDNPKPKIISNQLIINSDMLKSSKLFKEKTEN